ncbi:hypothetical protein ACFYUD_34055 [Nocardia tengchongensis]|uniref:hypothetical protein n=1 Tax=Nocardia tengchongensis TaxID=2055889 RepID=UPI00369D2E0E
MKHVWLVLRYRADEEDEPVRALTTKASAKAWVKQQDPAIQFRHEDAEYVVAGTRGTDWVARYLVQRIPFGDERERDSL